MSEAKTYKIAIVNEQTILIVENGEKMVPIKPICEALGVDFSGQRTKIEDDEILAPVVGLSPTTGADGKVYKMFCVPLKYVFGWLFTINPKNVKEEAKDLVLAYRKECYDVLYRYFTDHAEFYKQKQQAILEQTEKVKEVNMAFNTAKKMKKQAEDQMHKLASQSYEDWVENNRQLNLFAEPDGGNNE